MGKEFSQIMLTIFLGDLTILLGFVVLLLPLLVTELSRPRGMLEVYLDPNSPIIQNGQVDKNKQIILFCAGGVRSALAVKSLKEMGYEKISHIDGGFAAMSNSSFKII